MVPSAGLEMIYAVSTAPNRRTAISGKVVELRAVADEQPLTTSERKRLKQLEAVVEQGLETWVAVSQALLEIRDQRLYRADFPTFERYVNERWSIARRTAYGLIEAGAVLKNVPTSAHDLSLSLLRELAPLDADGQRELAPLISDKTVAEARRIIRVWRAQRRHLHEQKPMPPLPAGTFRTIVTDPPWSFADSGFPDYGDGLAKDVYATMSTDEIAALPVSDLAAPDAHLYVWVPDSLIPLALRVIESYGFTYRTKLTWVKNGMGLGTYFRHGTETALFATRGKLPTTGHHLNWFKAPRSRHSQKPAAFFQLVEAASPGPYLEMFARRRREGAWTVWGNELE
jgi:N6-adenosine-specific RNA methylase IME4